MENSNHNNEHELSNNILADLPERPENISNKDWHLMLLKYLEEKVENLPDELIPEIVKINKLIDKTCSAADKSEILNESIASLEAEVTLKYFKLLWFLEKFYKISNNFYSKQKVDEYFKIAILSSADNLDEEEFLSGIYPEYFSEQE